jgi:hypothetical protein
MIIPKRVFKLAKVAQSGGYDAVRFEQQDSVCKAIATTGTVLVVIEWNAIPESEWPDEHLGDGVCPIPIELDSRDLDRCEKLSTKKSENVNLTMRQGRVVVIGNAGEARTETTDKRVPDTWKDMSDGFRKNEKINESGINPWDVYQASKALCDIVYGGMKSHKSNDTSYLKMTMTARSKKDLHPTMILETKEDAETGLKGFALVSGVHWTKG